MAVLWLPTFYIALANWINEIGLQMQLFVLVSVSACAPSSPNEVPLVHSVMRVS
jgi:hypothetical protein